MGSLVPIHGTDPYLGQWTHKAFVPSALPTAQPELSGTTHRAIANARAALSALDATARQLPNPRLFRNPALRREAHSTSALEGTYAPFESVLTATSDSGGTPELLEVMSYVEMAEYGFEYVMQDKPLSVSVLNQLQGTLMQHTPLAQESGQIRTTQVVIGRRLDAPVGGFPAHGSRFIPSPPGMDLEAQVRDLCDWMRADHSDEIDPVVVAALSHYQFETLHPYCDGNGRLGRFLIVLQLLQTKAISEPTLTVSPWFEARRADYYDRLLAVSTQGDWDGYVEFFAQGIEAAAHQTRNQMLSLVTVQEQLKEAVTKSRLRAQSAYDVVDYATGMTTFTARMVADHLGLSYGRVNQLLQDLVDLQILAVLPFKKSRSFFAPRVLDMLLRGS